MLELIVILCGLGLLFHIPYQANKIRNGWVRESYNGTPDEFRGNYVKLLKSFLLMGLVVGCINAVLALFEIEGGEWIAKLLCAAIWFGVAGIAFHQRGRLLQPA